MKKRILRNLITAACMLFMISGCSSQKSNQLVTVEGLDQLGAIHVIAREEGSGTREVFAEKVNLQSKSDTSHADRITEQAQIAMNAASVIDAVAADPSAIGFVSLGAVSGNESGIKVIGINGVKPSGETISGNQYPLTRNLNIAYSGKLSDGGNDFLRYIVSAGQNLVEEHYVKVKTPESFLSDKSAGTLLISGSSSAAPLLEQLAEEYGKTYNPNLEITIQTSDSTSGLTAAMQGSSDWGMASRELKDYEKELLSFETIAKDGVAVIVNAENPAETLTVDQLTQIFEGTDQNWEDVNK